MKKSAFSLRAIGIHGRILSRGGLHYRKVCTVAVGVEDGLEGQGAAVGIRGRCQVLRYDATSGAERRVRAGDPF